MEKTSLEKNFGWGRISSCKELHTPLCTGDPGRVREYLGTVTLHQGGVGKTQRLQAQAAGGSGGAAEDDEGGGRGVQLHSGSRD